jgi:hypothetical protein
MPDEPEGVASHFLGRVHAAKKQRHREELASLDRRALSKMDDKALAIWQFEFEEDEPQWRIAEHEWQSRLITAQIRAATAGARGQAYFGIAGMVIGLLVNKILEILK